MLTDAAPYDAHPAALPIQRLLATLARADRVVRRIEVVTAQAIRIALCGTHPTSRREIERLSDADYDILEALSLAERRRLIRLCWLLVQCDGELHPREEVAIYALADRIGLSRRDVAQLQPDLSPYALGGAFQREVGSNVLMASLAACGQEHSTQGEGWPHE